MTSNRSTRQSGLPAEYYAPDYIIEVKDHTLDPETKGDILDLKVTLVKDDISGFQFTINNWDDKRYAFKYSDSKTFDLGNEVIIKLGYAGNLLYVMRGIITSLAPKFPESGSPTLVVGCSDRMDRLKGRKPKEGEQKTFVDMQDWQIAQAIANRNGLDFVYTEDGPQHELVVQKNQDDAVFLIERAKRIDFDCYIKTDPDSGKDTLFFIKPVDGRDGRPMRVYEFEWGKSLISFSPTLTAVHQVSKVTVLGWNPQTKQSFKYTADKKDLPGLGAAGESGPSTVAEKMNDREEVVVDQLVLSEQEAKVLAISRLRELAKEFNTGSGQIIGLADLRPGDNVELSKLGTRFSGRYEIHKVEHTLNNSGFTTGFEAKRIFDGGTL